MTAYEIAEVIAEYLVDNKDLIIAMIKDNDKETLQDEIYAELTEKQALMEESNMKIDVKKNGETILHREDAKSITDKGGAYEIAYADGTGQVVFKGENVAIELKD